MLAGLLLTFPASLWSTPSAWAQPTDRPLRFPKSDVTVTYRFDKEVPDSPRKLQIIYSKAGGRIRIDYFRWVEAKYPYLAVIIDRPADRVITVLPERRAYTERQVAGRDDSAGAFLKDDMVLSRRGTAMVAHASCTEWKIDVPGDSGGQNTACVTDDGITLRLVTPNVSSLTATDIRYGTPPDDVFNPPAGFHREPVP
jgi:hypothetical protein